LVVGGGGAAALVGLWVPPAARGRLGSLFLPALAVTAALLISFITSTSAVLSLVGSYSRYESLPVRLSYLLLFCLTAWLLRSQPQRRLVLTLFIGGCLVAALEALYQAATGFPPRPDGNLGQSNLLGALLAMAIPITAVRSLHSPRWALVLVALAAGLAVSSSRSGWLGAVAGCVLLLPLAARTKRTRRWLFGVAAAGVAAAILVLLLTPLASLHSDTGSARLHVWRDALVMIAARPLTGWGPESQGLVLGSFLTGNWEPGATFDRIHELGLDLLATQGVLGLAACAWFWGAWGLGCWRAWISSAELRTAGEEVPGLLGAWVGYLVATSLNFDWAPATGPAWLLAGLAWSAVSPAASSAVRPVPGLVRLPATIAALLAVLFLAGLPQAADLAYYRSDLRTAVALDPLQARYHRALGEALIGAGRLEAGAGELELAASLGEYDSQAYVELGDAYRSLGQSGPSRRAYRRALGLNPFDPEARQRLAAYSSSSSYSLSRRSRPT
jgi:O-antigen ligase